jgi:hypothetical protein
MESIITRDMTPCSLVVHLLLTFRRNVQPPASGPKNNPKKQPAREKNKSEVGGNTLLYDVREILPDDTVLNPTRC